MTLNDVGRQNAFQPSVKTFCVGVHKVGWLCSTVVKSCAASLLISIMNPLEIWIVQRDFNQKGTKCDPVLKLYKTQS